MKIEKVNSNQIKCFLNKGDLLSREIKVSELAYGTEKAQELFKDMMEQASHEFGFEVDNVPLMIEAVPLSTDSIMLIITKVDNPEELEDKFAALPNSDSRKFKKKEASAKEETLSEPETEEIHPTTGTFVIYKFNHFNDISRLAPRLFAFPVENSSLYRDRSHKTYLLALDLPTIDRNDFKVVRGLLSEYGEPVNMKKSAMSHLDEHYERIIKDKALEVLIAI